MKKTNPLYILLATGALVSTTANASTVYQGDNGESLDVTGRIYVVNSTNLSTEDSSNDDMDLYDKSRFGLKGIYNIDDDWSLLGRFETEFNAGVSTNNISFKSRLNYLKFTNKNLNLSFTGGKAYSPVYNSVSFVDFEAWSNNALGTFDSGSLFDETGKNGEGSSGAFYGTARADDMISIEYDNNGIYTGVFYQGQSHYNTENYNTEEDELSIQYNRDYSIGLGLQYHDKIGENQRYTIGTSVAHTDLKFTENSTLYANVATEYWYDKYGVQVGYGQFTENQELTDAQKTNYNEDEINSYFKSSLRYVSEDGQGLSLYLTYQSQKTDYAEKNKNDAEIQEGRYGVQYDIGPITTFVELQDQYYNSYTNKPEDYVYIGGWFNL